MKMSLSQSIRASHWLGIVCVGIAFCLGCGGSDGPIRYTLDGTVTMPDGQPVPAGELNFEPDCQSGNKGPASMIDIQNGKYSLPKDQGVLGGSYIVTIIPFDGKAFGESLQGKALIRQPYVEKVDFPKQNSSHDFKISIKK